MTVLPLASLKVVEFSHMVMGPTTGMVLADLGADVVKVEPTPNGDSTRALTGSGIGFYASFQRNRRSLCVDLKAPDGLALVLRLIAGSDILIENFRPGAMAKLGLGYAALSADHPRLIYCSCKGFLNGPYQHRTALDEVVQMMGGLAYMTGPVGRPLRAGSSVIDIMGGLSAAIAILSVVTERTQTGRGRYVEAALFETVALLMSQHMAQTAITGTAPPPMSMRTPAWPVYDVFETFDGGQVFVGVVTDTAWPAFCAAFGLEALAADGSLATKQQRVAERARTIPIIAEALRHYSQTALMEKCEALGLPYAPIGQPEGLFDDPHLNTNGGLVPLTLPDGRQVKLPALPITLDGERLGLRHDLHPAGFHNDEICAELGVSSAELARLRSSGIVL